ncbi:alpha/beta hydrolase [Luteimicrobium subarcticum]|uniref:Alpha-beta hydrolase superfamily lysophospholipase n=1 Tax=Luteimicrobium subarcticum TaxID=620910 RepID=A0A2M8WT79_9MICO|nr:alpha/beta hydrolase [Luteimicrobium subarcticum]PJI94143.1 alpha-beta hydrolase superfamily lysophospholipase [Luteimicrobium subarcticum]
MTTPADAAWSPDVLGEGFEQLTLPLGEDAEGELVATLVRYRPDADGSAGPDVLGGAGRAPGPLDGADVLYVHGWSDYFFQVEHARFWHALGARFHALDLHKYGRSLRPGQTPGFTSDLRGYGRDIEAALAVMGHGLVPSERTREDAPLVLVGHSTGGLTLSLWAAAFPGRASALVLNSPWLEFQAGAVARAAMAPAVGVRSRWQPRGRMPTVDLGFFTRTVSRRFGGEWDYDLAWRPEHGFPLHPAWLDAVFRAQAEVARGLGVELPVLVLLSTRSVLQPVWSEAMAHADVALDVDRVAQRSLDLGRHVTVARIEGALHDVLLSAPDVRASAYDVVRRWAEAYAGG